MSDYDVTATDHGDTCAGCADAVRAAIGMAAATGSVGCTHGVVHHGTVHNATVARARCQRPAYDPATEPYGCCCSLHQTP